MRRSQLHRSYLVIRIYGALCPTPYALHPTPYILHPTPHAPCPMPYALCPMPYALCPMPYTKLTVCWIKCDEPQWCYQCVVCRRLSVRSATGFPCIGVVLHDVTLLDCTACGAPPVVLAPVYITSHAYIACVTSQATYSASAHCIPRVHGITGVFYHLNWGWRDFIAPGADGRWAYPWRQAAFLS